MGVVDEFVRQKGVQHYLDRGIWRARVDQIGALDRDQFFVLDHRQRAELAHRLKPERGKAAWRDCGHVGPGGFDAQHLDFGAERIAHLGLERGIAAAVQHKLGIAT